MKRTAFLIVLLGLVVLELLLLESFVPYGWHHPISGALDHIFPPQEYKPHPNMDWEIEMVLRQHRSLRIGLYLLTAALATECVPNFQSLEGLAPTQAVFSSDLDKYQVHFAVA